MTFNLLFAIVIKVAIGNNDLGSSGVRSGLREGVRKVIELAYMLGGVAFMAAAGMFHRRYQRVSEKRRRQQELDQNLKSLFAIRGGVWIREPNGSEHHIQNLVEQELSLHGMVLSNLRREPTENLLKNGEWDPAIAASYIDVAVIGRIIVQTMDAEEVQYVTVQHVHTGTGLFFHQLPEMERRKNNCACYDFPCPYSGKYHYHESGEEFERRREMEKQVYPVRRLQCSLDVRFYAPGGIIRGGCVTSVPLDSDDPIRELVTKLVSELAAVARRSLKAEQTSLFEAEILNQLPSSKD